MVQSQSVKEKMQRHDQLKMKELANERKREEPET